MRVADGKHVEWVDEEAVVLDSDSGDLHYLNGPAAKVYALIGEYGYDKGLEELERQHGAEPDFKAQLDDVLKDMVEKGLLVDE
ncbi:MAG TPA: hypothetical protein VIG64_05785 [Actinomycetota bacterium]|jgi:hypothetical protein